VKDQLTTQEGIEGWERFWRNTQVLKFVIGPDGEKRAIRSSEARVMSKNDYYLDFKRKKKRKK
tara:strand:- start:222 stop:410 length:189 start_codon:yes stop_codon:yes gene_type:complete